ncbi:hypothetical protein [Niabella aquatica]
MPEALFSYDPLNDYRLILDLPAGIKEKVTAAKTAFDLEYKGMTIAGGQPFVYLAAFSQNESLEQEMSDTLYRIALGFMPFKAHLRNFDQTGHNEIFMPFEDVKPVELLIQRLKSAGPVFKNAKFNELPRISIARGLQPFQFNKSWAAFEHRRFSATFIVEGMLLLKRMEGFSSWQILRRLEFENMVVE